ncbi:MAG: NUDIX domain-containing protein [Patescibacteria group bacterium]
MKVLLTTKDQDIYPDETFDPDNDWKKREAARAIVFDDQGLIALMDVSKHGYHKLPGGGLDEGEKVFDALARELREETGCRAEVTREVGQIREYRKKYNQVQESYCYIAKLVGEKGEPSLEPGEIADGFKIMWVSIDEAIDLLSSDETDGYHGKFVLKRDLVFLKEAKKLL